KRCVPLFDRLLSEKWVFRERLDRRDIAPLCNSRLDFALRKRCEPVLKEVERLGEPFLVRNGHELPHANRSAGAEPALATFCCESRVISRQLCTKPLY